MDLVERGEAATLAALQAITPRTPAAAEIVQVERGNFAANAARMAYPAFRQQHLPLSSGAVESAAKHLVQHRLKRAGIRWSPNGAHAVLTLRCHLAVTAPSHRSPNRDQRW